MTWRDFLRFVVFGAPTEIPEFPGPVMIGESLPDVSDRRLIKSQFSMPRNPRHIYCSVTLAHLKVRASAKYTSNYDAGLLTYTYIPGAI